jgi:hypothetical protein
MRAKGESAMFPVILRRDILILLAVKAGLLLLLYLLFFSPAHRPPDVSMRDHILGDAPHGSR